MERREFVRAVGTGAVGASLAPLGGQGTDHGARQGAGERTMGAPIGTDVTEWRRHFPALDQRVGGKPLTYLDTAATSLRPRQMIDAISDFYSRGNANPGAALHTLARGASAAYEDARRTVATFINAADPLEVVFTRGTTDGLNLVAAAWGGANLRPGDEILIGLSEHASNMAPWQMIAQRTGATVRHFGIDDEGHASLDDFTAQLGPRTRIVAFSHVSNVLGMVNPAKEMCRLARAPGRIVVLDGAQSVPHFPPDVRDLGCDFLAFSSHKMLGPMGAGVLWGRRELLDAMPPYQGGSNMAHDVGLDHWELSEGALKFSAGSPNVAGPVGLAAAIRFLHTIGPDALWKHEQLITKRMIERLAALPAVRLLGSHDAAKRVAVFAFTMGAKSPAEILGALDREGIAIRAGDLASLPLLKRLGTTRAARASCYLYTTLEEVDRFADTLERVL